MILEDFEYKYCGSFNDKIRHYIRVTKIIKLKNAIFYSIQLLPRLMYHHSNFTVSVENALINYYSR